ncbi:hypothetical protein DL240_09155 [Lujinxingia litoralis]|uniref:DUF2313 domain-containing protein n=1 Tax=Lujinxingia litoralis TaxID=2211119 RepID=A0A328CB91_9DELT|nr:hypothetical protein [Lujinxingia litoralis]RAL23043.1 hypothetical protein DL240_09155 [Lujinxingia litoralis]
MSELTYIPDYPERTRAITLAQFRTSPRIQALINALATSAQHTEDLGFDTLLTNNVDHTRGQALERWGQVVGEPRRERSDDSYRPFIKARITANNVSGVADDFIELWRLITGAEHVRLFALTAGAFALVAAPSEPLSDTQRRHIRTFIESIRPAGIALVLIEAPSGAFSFDTGPGFNVGAYARIL